MKRLILFIFLGIPTIIFSQQNINELLVNAVINNNKDSVELLIKQGADPNYKTLFGVTPLMYAVENNNYDIVNILIDNGANINTAPPYDPPVLSFAVMNYQDSILDLLLSKNANVDIVDYSGRSPLYYAIIYGNIYAADQLLYHGANPDTIILGWTPLELAAYYNDTLLINMLVYYGADVNRQDSIGYTPLHVTAQYERLEAAKTLLENGSRLDMLSHNLASPVDIAIYQRNNLIFKYLFDQHPDFDNFINSKYDSYQLSILQQNYFAKRLFRKSGWRENFWAIDYIFYLNQSLSVSDYFIGLNMGMKELYSNIEILFGFNGRVFDKRVLFDNGDNSYLQLWEDRWSVFTQIDKNFFLFNTRKINHYLTLGMRTGISYASYRGSLRQENNKFYSPVIGYSLDYYRFMLSSAFYYMQMPYKTILPVYFDFAIGYRLPTYNLKISLKKKSPIIYGRSF